MTGGVGRLAGSDAVPVQHGHPGKIILYSGVL